MSVEFDRIRPHEGRSSIFKRGNKCLTWTANLKTGKITVLGRYANPADQAFEPIAVFDIKTASIDSINKNWAEDGFLADKTSEILMDCELLRKKLK